MPPERGLEGIAVEVGAEHQHAGLAAPVPFVLPITRALLIAGTTPRPRFGDFPAGREDGVALLRGDFGIGGFAVAWPEEERQPRRADNLTGPLVRAGNRRVGCIVPPSLEPQCRAVAYIDPVADGGMRAHVAETACARAVVVYGRIAAQDVEALLGAEVQHQAPRSEPHRKIRPPGLGTGSLYKPSPSIPSQFVIQKPIRPPPPIWLSNWKARSKRVYAANPPNSNWNWCWASSAAAPPTSSTAKTVTTRMGRLLGGKKATPKIGNSSGKRDSPSV